MNILQDPWVRVQDAEGNPETIRPLDIVKRPRAIADGRWEVQHGTLQLLIALAQTYLAPASDREWLTLLKDPPSVETFEEAVANDLEAFELFGDGYRFMQVPPTRREYFLANGAVKRVEEMLASTYSENSIKENKFFFDPAKPTSFSDRSISVEEMVALLYHLNATGYSKQCGNGTSCIRGNGIPTVILRSKDLWETVWFNVLNEGDMLQLPGDASLEFTYPWMRDDMPSRFGVEDFHPLTVLWWVIRDLYIEEPENEGIQTLYADVLHKGHSGRSGPSWEPGWRHPLSPYNKPDKKTGLPTTPKLSLDLNAGDWTYLRYGQAVGKETEGFQPRKSANIEAFERRSQRYHRKMGVGKRSLPPVHLSGLCLDKSKFLGVVDAQMPLISYDPSVETQVVGAAGFLIDYITDVADAVGQALGNALPKLKWYEWRDEARLWPAVETVFYDYLKEVADLALNGVADTDQERVDCADFVYHTAQQKFDKLSHYDSSNALNIGLRTSDRGVTSIPSQRARLERRLQNMKQTFVNHP